MACSSTHWSCNFSMGGLIFKIKFVKMRLSKHRGVSVVITMEEKYA